LLHSYNECAFCPIRCLNRAGWCGYNLKNGDTISLALDLDRNKYFTAINGTWNDRAEPNSSEGGRSLREAENYTLVAEVAYAKNSDVSDAWVANFGSLPFKYDLPKNFRPFGEEKVD
jgi:hypothetical protein